MTPDDDLMPLSAACDVHFRGLITPATLRAAAGRGSLVIYKIGKRQFTTSRDIRAWVDRCREQPKARGSISTQSGDNGSSETDRISSAQVALTATLEKLKSSSQPTSETSSSRQRDRRRRSQAC